MSLGRVPKIVLWDLETLPNMREVMKVYPQLSAYPGLTLKATITSIICFGWKNYGDPITHCVNAWDFPERWAADINDDEAVVREAYRVLHDADQVITFNGKKFDWKYLQTRLYKYKLPPLGKLKHIDLCAEAKKNLYLFNNRLTTVGKFMVGQDKMENGGWQLWCDVMDKIPAAMQLMTEYCKQDVNLLEPIYRDMRPLITGALNQNLVEFVGSKKLCPACGSTRLHSHGWRDTAVKSYRRYLCADCGALSRTDIEDRNPRPL